MILCGGAGARLWPLSQPGCAKPFLRLFGTQTLLATTAARFRGAEGFAAPIIIGSAANADAIEAELGGDAELLLEPAGRNTAPAAAAAALAVEHPETLILILPSDHLVRDTAGLLDAVALAAPFAREGRLMVFGIRPDRPETGYGYIRRGGPLAAGVFEAAEFIEKPDRPKAEALLAAGGYEWNAGIFLMRADALLAELAAHAPAVLAAAKGAVGSGRREGNRLYLDEEAFSSAPAVSIDVAVMERAARVGVVPVDVGWSDVGTWDAVLEASEADAEGNVLSGSVRAEQTRGCYIRSDGPPVVAAGVEDLIVVVTADGVLVTRRRMSQAAGAGALPPPLKPR